jgi:stearoyl-CoA desaturase (delta-9 desaturase)
VLGFALFGLGAFFQHEAPALHTTGAQMLIWGFFVSTVVLAHGTFTINSLAHVIGRRRYETGDDSRNSFTLAMVTLGEGWHNNHHHYPAAARNGFFWWEIDFTYYGLKMLEAFGVIWDLRKVPEQLLDENRVDTRPRVIRAEMPAPIRMIASARPRISSALQNAAQPALSVTEAADSERVA